MIKKYFGVEMKVEELQLKSSVNLFPKKDKFLTIEGRNGSVQNG